MDVSALIAKLQRDTDAAVARLEAHKDKIHAATTVEELERLLYTRREREALRRIDV